MGPHVPILKGKVEIRVTGLQHVDTVLCRQREQQRSGVNEGSAAEAQVKM